MNTNAALGVVLVFVGCCSNVIFLELLVKYDPGSGNLITFSQFLFIAVEGLIFTSKFGQVRPKIGLKDYSIIVGMFFVSSVFNNYAFDFNIPMPLHMIFRAGSLIANMIMGIIILKKRYSLSKYLSVFMITLGIAICTIVSSSNVKGTGNPNVVEYAAETSQYAIFYWCTGIALLTGALFISARMGIYQEVLYKRYGKYPKEALFYTHLMPLPGFLIMYKNIAEHLLIAISSPPLDLPVLNIFGLEPPIMIVYLIANMLTQYVCISSVYLLTAECTSLTVTLVVTLRKFVSLLFSIIYFKNEFSVYHWIGTYLVFMGTIIFTELIPSIKKIFASKTSAARKVQ